MHFRIIPNIFLFATWSSFPLVAYAAALDVLEIRADGPPIRRTLEEYKRLFSLDSRASKDYELDCSKVPEVCANICYYHYCKNGSLTQTPKSGRTEAPACGKRPNKCSTKYKGPEGAYPHSGYQCDEFPLASTVEGGNSNAATRCVPGKQNSSAGGKFKFPNGTPVLTGELHKPISL